MANIIYGVVESVEISKVANNELWSFQIKDEAEKIISLNSLTRHFSDPILTKKPFTVVYFKNDDGRKWIEVNIPREEVSASLSNIKVFEGKRATIKVSE